MLREDTNINLKWHSMIQGTKQMHHNVAVQAFSVLRLCKHPHAHNMLCYLRAAGVEKTSVSMLGSLLPMSLMAMTRKR